MNYKNIALLIIIGLFFSCGKDNGLQSAYEDDRTSTIEKQDIKDNSRSGTLPELEVDAFYFFDYVCVNLWDGNSWQYLGCYAANDKFTINLSSADTWEDSNGKDWFVLRFNESSMARNCNYTEFKYIPNAVESNPTDTDNAQIANAGGWTFVACEAPWNLSSHREYRMKVDHKDNSNFSTSGWHWDYTNACH